MPGYEKKTIPDQSLVNVQVFPQEKKTNFLADKQAKLPIQPLTLSSPFMPPQFATYMSNFMKNFYTPFIYKDYNINIGGPAEDQRFAATIYEDALPSLNVYYSYKTLRDRNNLTDYVRSNFINVSDGEFTNFAGGNNSLNSRLKLIELSPFRSNVWSSNPYYNLPPGLLIYSSCYPIIADRSTGVAQCAKNSVGINVRLYSVTAEELISRFPTYKSTTLIPVTTGTTPEKPGTPGTPGVPGTPEKPDPTIPPQDKFNIWRELLYYEFIRNSISRGNLSPNFIQSYCFFLCTDLKLDYSKNGKLDPNTLTDSEKRALIAGKKDIALLTESPNMNLIQWTSNLYASDANIKKQIYSGFKTKETWEPIVFQMLAVFHLMNKFEFTLVDMNLINNFFIKDVSQYVESGNQFWIYRINNIDYYVPCKGQLLLIDSDYHVIDKKDPSKYKIIGKMFSDSKDSIKKEIISNAINCFNPNYFTSVGGSTLGVVKPPQPILDLFKRIFDSVSTMKKSSSDLDDPDAPLDPTDPDAPLDPDAPSDPKTSITTSKITGFEEIILNQFGKYLHNRIGTMIRVFEKDYIKKMDVTPFKKGEMVIYECKYETYEIVLYLENVDEYKCNCVTREVRSGVTNIVIKSIPKEMLFHYSDTEQIKQDVIPGQAATSLDYLIETYII